MSPSTRVLKHKKAKHAPDEFGIALPDEDQRKLRDSDSDEARQEAGDEE